MDLLDYVNEHTQRGECGCGRCCDRGDAPEPEGHTVNMEFFTLGLRGEPTRADFEATARAHRGEFCDVDPFDGKEHSYMELGGWIGDQGLALQFMGLGALVGAFKLLTPTAILPDLPSELRQQMAQAGMVSVIAA